MEWISYNTTLNSLSKLMDMCSRMTKLNFVMDTNSTSGRFRHYVYKPGQWVEIGTQALQEGSVYGCVSSVDFVSMHKQCFHELQHVIQHNDLYLRKSSDDVNIRKMARQAMISDVFPNYESENYWDISYEIDAELHSIVDVKNYLSDKFDFVMLDRCIVDEINRRYEWWGDRPVLSVNDALCALHDKQSVCRLPDEIDFDTGKYPIAASFMFDKKLMKEYFGLPDDKKDRFLIDYICHHDIVIPTHYPVITDEFPDVKGLDNLKRYTYRMLHNLPDDNDYEQSRAAAAEEKFGHITPDLSSNNYPDFSP